MRCGDFGCRTFYFETAKHSAVMIKNCNKTQSISAKLSPREIEKIKSFILGAVYGFCNNCKEDNGENGWFALYDLFGQGTFYWYKPLKPLYDYYVKNGDIQIDAIIHAAKDINRLLKEVLSEDDRFYEKNCCQDSAVIEEYRLINIEFYK